MPVKTPESTLTVAAAQWAVRKDPPDLVEFRFTGPRGAEHIINLAPQAAEHYMHRLGELIGRDHAPRPSALDRMAFESSGMHIGADRDRPGGVVFVVMGRRASVKARATLSADAAGDLHDQLKNLLG